VAVQERHPSHHVAVDLARTVVAHDVDGADPDALAALVTRLERLASRQRCDLIERRGVVVGDHARLEHPVPVTGQVDALDDCVFLLPHHRSLLAV